MYKRSNQVRTNREIGQQKRRANERQAKNTQTARDAFEAGFLAAQGKKPGAYARMVQQRDKLFPKR